jgi:tRNA threonylcarbamoyladenosine biosynthesis protein TsaE
MKEFTFISKSEEETKRLAKRISHGFKKNDCLALIGDFGSGKTTFVRGLASGLKRGKKDYVCSPSFVILKIYRGRLPIYHFDLYRLSREEDFHDIGLSEFITAGGVAVIEWADKIRRYLPPEHLLIEFKVAGPCRRRLRFYTASRRLKHLIEKIIR